MPHSVDSREMTARIFTALDVATRSYDRAPAAARFGDEFDATAHRLALQSADRSVDEPWTLHLRLPHCNTFCAHCERNDGTRHEALLRRYLDQVVAEVDAVCSVLDHRKRVTSVLLGGGTPNTYPVTTLARLVLHLRRQFDITADAELAIELDPRLATGSYLPALAQLGFNRIALGIQDFDPVVQRAIGRVHDYRQTLEMCGLARRHGFRSVRFDLVYGLPFQSRQGFRQTMEMVVEAAPDRVSLQRFVATEAHPPLSLAGCPEPYERWRLLELGYDILLAGGYVPAGAGHFARPDDAVALAVRTRALKRTLSGYSDGPPTDVLAFGAGATSHIDSTYVYNVDDVDDYMAALARTGWATGGGGRPSAAQERHAWVVDQLMCYGNVSGEAYRQRFGRAFEADHSAALRLLARSPFDVLIRTADARGVVASDPGARLIEVVAATFVPHMWTPLRQVADDVGTPFLEALAQ